MGTLSPNEQACTEMHPTWLALPAVAAHRAALTRFVVEELPKGSKFDADGMNAALALAVEFRDIWPHRIPDVWELVEADRAGVLAEKIAALDAEFKQ